MADLLGQLKSALADRYAIDHEIGHARSVQALCVGNPMAAGST